MRSPIADFARRLWESARPSWISRQTAANAFTVRGMYLETLIEHSSKENCMESGLRSELKVEWTAERETGAMSGVSVSFGCLDRSLRR